MSEHNEVVERVSTIPFSRTIQRQSVLSTATIHTTRYECPRCGEDLGELEHGEPMVCKCRLGITRFGASFELRGTP